MRFTGTWNRYSTSAMPQEASAATSHGLPPSVLRCAYQANVMKTLERTSKPAACQNALGIESLPPLARPAPHLANVEVHEVRDRIIADAARGPCEREIAQPLDREPDKPHVDRLAFQVQAPRRDTVGGGDQHRVGRRRTVARDDLVARLEARARGELVQEVEEARIEGQHVA